MGSIPGKFSLNSQPATFSLRPHIKVSTAHAKLIALSASSYFKKYSSLIYPASLEPTPFSSLGAFEHIPQRVVGQVHRDLLRVVRCEEGRKVLDHRGDPAIN